MKTYITEKLQAICLLGLLFGAASSAIAQTPVVNVQAIHYGGKVQYHYQVVNSGPDEIPYVWIGHDGLNNTYELKAYPSGMVDPTIPPESVTSPYGWDVMLIEPEETLEHSIRWDVNDNSPRLAVGQTLSGMSITLDKMDNTYVTSHATLHFSNYPATKDITVLLQRLDVTPPTLTITLSPNVLRTTERLVPITATITARDNYDPAPEIQLESITANEVLDTEDIKDAQFGTDDRQFSLKADRHRKPGRIYTVTYSATDASGNKTLASATVTVPHDERGSDVRRDGKDKKDESEREQNRLAP